MARQSWKHNRGPTLLCPTGTCLSWRLSSWSIWNLILLLLSLLYFLLLVNLVCAFWRWHLADCSIPLPSLEKKTGLYLFATATWGSSVCVKLVVNWHILFLVIKLASIRLCRHQEWGRRSTRESTICPGALLVMRRTAAPLDQFPQGPWLQPHVVSLYLVPLSNTPLSIPSCLRPSSQQCFTTGDRAGGISAAFTAGDEGCFLLGCSHSRNGYRQQVHSQTAAPTTGCLGEMLQGLCQALWWLEVHPEGNWHFVQGTDHGPSSWELTCKREQLCCDQI